jgi:hypothetical protein
MGDINVRSDSVDVEQIMSQIRARIREKRGVDYTEEEIRELARVKLEKFLDPGRVRSDLIEQFRQTKAAMPPPTNFSFEDSTLFDSNRGVVRVIRKLLKPILKLFFNPNPLIRALHIQSELNTRNAQRENLDSLHYELIHNLVLETTRLGIEVKNLKMRLESMSSRLDFDERRARALEGVVQYRPGVVPPLQPPAGGAGSDDEQAERRTRRRRRRGRRRDGRDEGQPRPEGTAASSAGQPREAGGHSEMPADAPSPHAPADATAPRPEAPADAAPPKPEANAGGVSPKPEAKADGVSPKPEAKADEDRS